MRKALAIVAAALALASCATTTRDPFPSTQPRKLLVENGPRGAPPLYALDRDLVFCNPADGAVVIVPKGFVSDLASVPELARFVELQRNGAYENAAIVHDWMYAVGEPGRRAYADQVFFAAMRYYRVGERDRGLIETAVAAYSEVQERLGLQGFRSYGLPADWRFAEVDGPGPVRLLPRAPFAKPRSAVVGRVPGCQGFEQKAHRFKTAWRR